MSTNYIPRGYVRVFDDKGELSMPFIIEIMKHKSNLLTNFLISYKEEILWSKYGLKKLKEL